MTNVFLKISITHDFTQELTTLKTYEVANPFTIIDNPEFITNDIDLVWKGLELMNPNLSVGEVEFTVRDYDNVVIYKAYHPHTEWRLEYVPRVIDAEAILKSILEIENWEGNAYQDGDEVDLALLNIRKEIGAPR